MNEAVILKDSEHRVDVIGKLGNCLLGNYNKQHAICSFPIALLQIYVCMTQMQIHIHVYFYLSVYAPNMCIVKSKLIEDTDLKVRLNRFPNKSPPFSWTQTQDVLDGPGAII